MADKKKHSLAGLLLGFRKTGDYLKEHTFKIEEDVGHLLDLHKMLEVGKGGKAVLIERLFEEILSIRLQQSAMDTKLDTILLNQQHMIEALNLPID